MIIRNELRPTMMRTNSRYRGVTEREKYSNFIGETVHDLRLLGKVMFYDQAAEKEGHEFNILNNFAAYMTGEANEIKCSAPSASLLSGVKGDIKNQAGSKMTELIPTATWTTYGGCTKSTTLEGISLASNGSYGTSGIGAQLEVEEGQIIYIRMAVKNTGTVPVEDFALGSANINQDRSDMTKYKIPQNGSTIYIDKRLYCSYRELITLNIDVQNTPEVLSTPMVEISEVEIRYMTEREVGLLSLDGGIKPRVNVLEDKVENIIKNI